MNTVFGLDYIREYKRFINSYYLTNGLKITVSIILPALVCGYYGKLSLGIDLSIGALCVSIIDSPGPFHHRRNSMFIGLLILFPCSLVSLVFSGTILGYVFILILSFALSIISLYGTRATNIGLCGLFGIVFSLSSKGGFVENFQYSLILFSGGLYYLLFSSISYRILPFELARKALGECIFKTSQYIANRSRFYGLAYQEKGLMGASLKDQLEVLEAQKVARELLLKNKELLKESNHRGRALVLIFIEILDVYDELSATHADYTKMHEAFNGSSLLKEIGEFILDFSNELDGFGRMVAGNLVNFPSGRSWKNLHKALQKIEDHIQVYHQNLDQEKNLQALLSIRRVERSLRRSVERLKAMKQYLNQEKVGKIEDLDINSFVDHEDFSLQLLYANLKLPSVYFRHAIRVSIAMAAGLSILPFLAGHRGYWILLTIIVILKPGFSISKTRTTARLIGTLLGAGIAFLLLFLIHSPGILFGLMVFFMFLSYSFSTLNYLVSVFSTSVFVLILFHFLYPGNLNYVPDRILDTAIGFTISILSIYLVFPSWEFLGLPVLIIKSLEASKHYFQSVNTLEFTSDFNINTYKLARKEIYLRLSNQNSALERMAGEPTQKQIHLEDFHKLTVLITQFAASIASIGSHLFKNPGMKIDPSFRVWAELTYSHLEKSIQVLGEPQPEALPDNPEMDNRGEVDISLNSRLLQELTHRRFEEIRDGILESETQIRLREFSLLHEQFEYLAKLSRDILMECQKIPTISLALEV